MAAAFLSVVLALLCVCISRSDGCVDLFNDGVTERQYHDTEKRVVMIDEANPVLGVGVIREVKLYIGSKRASGVQDDSRIRFGVFEKISGTTNKYKVKKLTPAVDVRELGTGLQSYPVNLYVTPGDRLGFYMPYYGLVSYDEDKSLPKRYMWSNLGLNDEGDTVSAVGPTKRVYSIKYHICALSSAEKM